MGLVVFDRVRGPGSAADHGQVQALFPGAGDGDRITGIGMAHDAGAGIVGQYTGDAFCCGVGAVADDDHARVLGEAHADPTAMMN